ncbi:MAG: aminopeptidase P family protein [Firmicutes bacterium]|nr:aminopeptidase P family protein [Bacillota bacterium]
MSGKTQRITALQQKLVEMDIDAAILVLSRDVFYYTGTSQPSILLVTPADYRLFVRRALPFVLAETWVDPGRIVYPGDFKEVLAGLKPAGIVRGRLGLELDVIPASLYLRLVRMFSEFEPVNISDQILRQRMRKDTGEVELIRAAGGMVTRGHQRVLESLREGMTELELAAEVEDAHRRAGHEGAFAMRNFDFFMSRGPLSSGENLFRVSGFANTITGVGLSPAMPAGPSRRVIEKGDTVIIDIPTCCQGYHFDETRTYVLGRASGGVRALYSALREISDQAAGALKAGARVKDVYDTASTCASRLGVSDYFLGLAPNKANFIGHGIGLELNEPPVLFAGSDFELPESTVTTIEIHLTHPEHGAVKLEDTVLVTDAGCEFLSSTPRELFEV